MADTFDPANVQKSLESSFGDLETSRAAVNRAVTTGTDKITKLDNQFLDTIQGINTQVNSGFDELQAAQRARIELERNPPILNRLMSALGDEDYSAQFQTQRALAAQTKVQRANNRMETATTQHRVNTTLVKGEVAAELTKHGLIKDKFTEIGTALSTMTQAMANEGQRRSTMLARFSDADLIAMNTGKLNIPPSLTAGHVEADTNRRSNIKTEMRNVEILLEANELQLADTKRAQVIQQFATTDEISNALKSVDETGNAVLYGSQFTEQQLREGLASATQRDKGMIETAAGFAIQKTEFDKSATLTQGWLTAIGRNADGVAFDPENPLASLPTQLAVDVASTQKQIDRAISLGAAETAVKLQQDLEARTKKHIDDQIEVLPDEEQPAASEFYFNNGQVSPANAQESVVSFATDVNALQDGPLANVWPAMSKAATLRMQQYAQTGGGMGLVDGQIVQAPQKLPPEVVAAEMANTIIFEVTDPTTNEVIKVTPKHILADTYMQQFMADQFTQLAQVEEQYSALLDPDTGTLSQDQFRRDAKGNLTWLPEVTVNKLVGINQGNITALEEVLTKMQTGMQSFARSVDKNSATSPEEAALNQIIYGNNAGRLIGPRFNVFAGKAIEMFNNKGQTPEQQAQAEASQDLMGNIGGGPSPTSFSRVLDTVLGN